MDLGLYSSLSGSKRVRSFKAILLDWYSRNARKFPWRETNDSFRILIAEVLLQRSRAKTVATVYKVLFEIWPDPISLANAEILDVEEIIRPLGLISRATTLVALAKEVVKSGAVPDSYEGMVSLPGVGRYIASATLATAFNKPSSLVDSVTARVYRRFFGIETKIGIDEDIWSFVDTMIKCDESRDLNWAVLDLAAIKCLPKVPRCDDCPLKKRCARHISSIEIRTESFSQ